MIESLLMGLTAGGILLAMGMAVFVVGAVIIILIEVVAQWLSR